MPVVLDALSRLWEELALLAVQTGRTLRQLAAPVLGLMLLGWSAYELSLLLASTLILPVMASAAFAETPAGTLVVAQNIDDIVADLAQALELI